VNSPIGNSLFPPKADISSPAVITYFIPTTITDIHRLDKAVEETLCPAMEAFVLDIMIGKGPAAKNVSLSLPSFTVIGTTTRIALMRLALSTRFGAVYRLDFYSLDALIKIVTRAAVSMNISIDDETARAIAAQAHGTPRLAIALLKRLP
jgi:holliday junction DNA helicase RuvB